MIEVEVRVVDKGRFTIASKNALSFSGRLICTCAMYGAGYVTRKYL